MPKPANTDKHYIRHLVKLNEENAVLAKEDIISKQGQVLVAQGQAIDAQAQQALLGQSITKAIEQSIELEHMYSARQMYECMQDHLEEVGLDVMVSTFQLEKVIKAYLEYACKNTVIRLKLSIMAHCLPIVFNRSLISASSALAICKEMKTDSETAKVVFMAALLADTGLLHIDPQVAALTQAFSEQQWAQYQTHVAISKSFADAIPKLNKQVGRAIAEHHERSDGFGYPLQKFGDELCLEGRILAKADTIMAVYRKRVLEEGYGFSVIIPVLQFSSANNNATVNNAAMRLLYRASCTMPPKPATQSILELIPKLINLLANLNVWLQNIQIMLDNYQEQLSKPQAKRHVQMYLKLKQGLDSSGLLSEHQHHWLQDVLDNQTQDEFHVVEQFAVMLYEIEFQCRYAHRHFAPMIPQLFGDGAQARNILKASKKLSVLLQA